MDSKDRLEQARRLAHQLHRGDQEQRFRQVVEDILEAADQKRVQIKDQTRLARAYEVADRLVEFIGRRAPFLAPVVQPAVGDEVVVEYRGDYHRGHVNQVTGEGLVVYLYKLRTEITISGPAEGLVVSMGEWPAPDFNAGPGGPARGEK